MFRSPPMGVRTPIRYFSMRHLPRLEHLEPRLPPGDALLGVLFALSLTRSSMIGVEYNPIHHEVWILEDDIVVETPIEQRLGCTTHVGSQSSTNDDKVSTKTIAAPSTAALGGSLATLASRVPASSSLQGWHVSEAPMRWITAPDSPAAKAWSAAFGHGARVVPALAFEGPASAAVTNEAQQSQVMDRYDTLPVSFEANHGQTDSRVDFIARTGGMTTFLTPTAAVFAIQNSKFRIQNSELTKHEPSLLTAPAPDLTPHLSTGVGLHMQIVGGDPNVRAAGVSPLSGKVNYFIGNDPSQWHANVPTFGRVEYQEVYPGIDLVYYGNNQQLEYDFVVSPGADPKAIMLNFAGGDGAEIDDGGNLVVHTAAGDLVQQKPYLYQEVNGMRHTIAGNFVLDLELSTQHSALVSFDIGDYDPSRPLIIDPVILGYSTFLGGSAWDIGRGIAVDGNGNAYVTGYTESADFPTTPGAFDKIYNDSTGWDAYVTKLNAEGSALAYSTFLGGSKNNQATGIAVDDGANAYVVGVTSSTDFPTTPDAFDTDYNGVADAFVTKLNPNGSALVYSTFLGASAIELGYGIAVDDAGNAYVTGETFSTNFPTTPGALDTTYNGLNDAFVTKLNTAGSNVVYSTFLGGGGEEYPGGIAVDPSGRAYVTGRTTSSNFPTTPGDFDTTHNGQFWDAFVTKLNMGGSTIGYYSTFLGGSGNDYGNAIAVDSSGSAYVIGETNSSNFPITPGAFDTTYNSADVFVTKLNAPGSKLGYSTFMGGSNGESGYGIAVDGTGDAYVTGETHSNDFPTTPGAFDTSYNAGNDAFVAKVSADGSTLAYSTYLGGTGTGTGSDEGTGIAVDGNGNAYVTGWTSSTDYPTTPDAFDTNLNGETDAIVTKFSGFMDVSPTAKPN